MESLGVTAEELDIRPAATQMLEDMGHPFGRGEAVYDVTFENVQAGLRTDYLFRIANQRGGIVLGTGDLSELALGWCTYGVGDQMSHYGVNSRRAEDADPAPHPLGGRVRAVRRRGRRDARPRSSTRRSRPSSSRPRRARSRRAPRTTIGPYALQDFTLFHVLRRGYRPSKIAFLAWHAWRDSEAGEWPPGYPDADADGVRPGDDPALARGLRAALLRQPVQALGAAQRAQGRRRRLAVAARRLAYAVRRDAGGVAGELDANVPE